MLRIALFIILMLGAFVGVIYLIRRMGAGEQASRYAKAIGILVLLLIFVFLPMFIFSQAMSVVEIFKFGVNSFVNSVGVSIWLARGVVFLLIFPFLWALGKAFSFRSKSRNVGLVVVALYGALYCFTMFQLQRNVYFRHDKGVASKWYCPTDYRVFDTEGFDPNCGAKLEPVTKEVADVLRANRNRPAPPPDGTHYFDMRTREPRKWYYETPEGEYELFDAPGFHPRYQVMLKPITPEVVRIIEGKGAIARSVEAAKASREADEREAASARSAEAAFRSRYCSGTPPRVAGRTTLILAVSTALDESGRLVEGAFSENVGAALETAGFAIHQRIIKQAAFGDGIVQRLSSGDTAVMGQLGLRESGDYLLLCRLSSEYSDYKQLRGQTTCVSVLDYRLVSTSTAKVLTGTARGSGLGKTRDEALANAARPLAADLNKSIRALLGR